MKISEQDNATNSTESTINRRAFVKGAGFTGLGLAGAALVAGKLGVQVPGASALGVSPSSVEAAAITDVDIFNFALNLEYLEAEFYTMALTGKTLAESGFELTGTGDYGKTTGGQKIDFSGVMNGSSSLRSIAEEITYDEQTHVKLLRSILGSAAIAKPAIDLNAMGAVTNYKEWTVSGRAFEDTGSSAYGGAAPMITSKTHLATAAGILMTEVYHASNQRLILAGLNIPSFALDSKDFPPPPTGKKYFDNTAQALGVVRTTGEVLAIVYHNSASGTKRGGYFPSGVNGSINTV